MNVTLQSGRRSPKPMNGSTSLLKSGSDCSQNNGTSFPSQVRGRKRERECSSKIDDTDSVLPRTENFLKSEIAKITDRGGLVDMDGVQKLVQLMLPEKSDRKIELAGRSLLASVISATDNFDCLSHFVQLRGVPILDEWLQEAHKGNIGDGGSRRDNDKSIEEFLLVLLRALDRLPVNLNALQMCNIGKSVNYLRSHKNLDIHKKARSLVDTWKKRVEAEMNSHDAKAGPVPYHDDVSHGGNKMLGGSPEAVMKSSVTQVSGSKSTSVNLIQVDSVKPASVSLGALKSVALSPSGVNNSKDVLSPVVVGDASDHTRTVAREGKSISSGQSHNNSQSCSSDHAKMAGLQGKEDVRSSTAGSMSVTKMSASAWHGKPVNGFSESGPTLSGIQRVSGSSKTCLHSNPLSEKVSQSGQICGRTGDLSFVGENGQKLLVKIPNQGHSPAHSTSGGSFEDPSVINSQASPLIPEKNGQSNLRGKSDSYQANIVSDVKSESWQSNDLKDILTGSDDGDGSAATVQDEGHCRTSDDEGKLPGLPKSASFSSGSELKPGKLLEASFSSMNSLIESCSKYSKPYVSVSAEDDVGMNLLANVAAGEMSKSDLVFSNDSPTRKTALVVEYCTSKFGKQKASDTCDCSWEQVQPNVGGDNDKQCMACGSWGKDGLHHLSKHPSPNFPVDGKIVHLSGMDLQQTIGLCLETSGRLYDTAVCSSVLASTAMGKAADGEEGSQCDETKKTLASLDSDRTPAGNSKASSCEDKVNNLLSTVKNENVTEGSTKVGDDVRNNENEGLNCGVRLERTPPATKMHSNSLEKSNEVVPLPSFSDKDLSTESTGVKAEGAEEISVSHVCQTVKPESEQENVSSPTPKNQTSCGSGSAAANKESECAEKSIKNKKFPDHQFGGSACQAEQYGRCRESKLTGTEAKVTECISTADASSFSATAVSGTETKVEFDLNEGLNVDDGKYVEPVQLMPSGCLAAVNVISPLPFPISSVSSGVPASITIASAAKGAFLPLEDLLRSKGEPGWKGSAATSAFRPAEPRKILELPLGSTSVLVSDVSYGKQGRPPLDFDLNVPDERIYEDMNFQNTAVETGSIGITSIASPVRASGELDLDLNQIDETIDLGQCSTNNGHKLHVPDASVRSSSLGKYPDGEVSLRGDFDLNNGPGVDEMSIDPSPYSQHSRNSMPTQASVACVRMNDADAVNFSSWFPPGNAYSAVAVSSVLPDRGEQPFPIVATGGPPRVLGVHTSGSPFGPDACRGPVLSSSPAGSFPSTSFQYPDIPCGANFHIPSATFSVGSTTCLDSSSGGRLCFPATTQLTRPAGTVSSQFQRPYLLRVSDGSNSGGMGINRKWRRLGLDLNAGPVGVDMEGRDDTMPLARRQVSVAGSKALAEEQMRTYQVAGGILKRKDPERGWDAERFSSRQPSWP